MPQQIRSSFRQSTPLDTLAAALPAGDAAVRGFAAGVANRLAAGPLTHAERKRLFARAAVLGLGRFEANLLIAIAERQAGAIRPRTAVDTQLSARTIAFTIATVQVLIVGAVWWTFV